MNSLDQRAFRHRKLWSITFLLPEEKPPKSLELASQSKHIYKTQLAYWLVQNSNRFWIYFLPNRINSVLGEVIKLENVLNSRGLI